MDLKSQTIIYFTVIFNKSLLLLNFTSFPVMYFLSTLDKNSFTVKKNQCIFVGSFLTVFRYSVSLIINEAGLFGHL